MKLKGIYGEQKLRRMDEATEDMKNLGIKNGNNSQVIRSSGKE